MLMKQTVDEYLARLDAQTDWKQICEREEPMVPPVRWSHYFLILAVGLGSEIAAGLVICGALALWGWICGR